MTEALTIYNTAGTVNLMSASSQVGTGYFSDFMPSIGAGREPDSITTDTFPLYVGGTSRADLANKINALQQMFEQARVWQDTKAGLRTFVNWQPEGYAAGRRSEIVGASYYLRDGFKTQFSRTDGHRALLDVEITRRNWWEGAETQISLTNENGADNTSGLPIYHNNTAAGTAPAKQINYVDITPEKVAGEVACNVRIELTYVGGTVRAPIFIQSSNDQAFGYSPDFWNDAPGAGWAGTASASSTGGTAFYQYLDAGDIGTVSLSSFADYLAYFKTSGNYRAFVSLAPLSTGQTLKMWNSFTDHGGAGQALYYQTNSNPLIIDMGMNRFPSNANYIPGTLSAASVDFFVQAVTAGTVYFDWCAMVRCDGYIGYSFEVASLAGSTILYDDGLDNKMAYLYNTSTTRIYDLLNSTGKQITLMPNRYNRIHMFPYETDYIGGQSTMKLYYRPRYLCL